MNGPMCNVTSPYPLIYVSSHDILTLNEAYELIAKHKPEKNKFRRNNKPHAIVWARYRNQIEVCFDLTDVALRTGTSLPYVKLISNGTKPPARNWFMFPLHRTGLVGYTREQVMECYQLDTQPPKHNKVYPFLSALNKLGIYKKSKRSVA